MSSKRKKSYYASAGWKRKRGNKEILEKNEKGFLITCNNRERECIREAYLLLGEFADKLYGPEHVEEPENDSKSNKNIDVDAEIAKEIEKLKEDSSKTNERRFQSVDCGAKNLVFIKTKVPDPCELVLSILTTIQSEQKQRSRFILRLMPILTTCRSTLEDIKKAMEPLLLKYFKNTSSPDSKTFAIVVKIRNNTTIKRGDVIETLAPMILDANNKVDLTMPQLSVIVEVMGKITCLSVVSDYFQLKKYNVVELINIPKEKPKVSEAAQNASSVGVVVSEVDEEAVVESSVTKPNSRETVPTVPDI